MENRKDVGKAFREKLDQLKKSPDQKVWASIQATLQEKKKRRLIPFWLKASGIATGILILAGFFLKPVIKEHFNTYTIIKEETHQNDQLLEKSKTLKASPAIQTKKDRDDVANKSGIITANVLKNANRQEKNNKINHNKPVNPQKKLWSNRNYPAGKSVQAIRNSHAAKDVAKTDNELYDYQSVNTETIQEINTKEENLKINNNLQKTQKNSRPDPLADKKTDSIIPVLDKIYVYGYISPSVYKALPKESVIDKRLDDYNVRSEINFNYGINIGINTSERWSFRTGIAIAHASLTTENIKIATASQSSVISGHFENIESAPPYFSNALIASALGDSIINIKQEFKYLEIPLEAKFKFFEYHRLNIEALGGLSSLYLKKNEVIAEAQNGNKAGIGKTSQTNQFSFTANLGLGLSYKLFRNVQINIEPMFKYNFRPFHSDIKTGSLNIQTGIQYNFGK
ncbi:MAG TPA: outer membrane beta-barrel protein [Flavobacterium sp.]|nr:outer membrane beta-barrel protein [Flavobacterium sp.]